MFNAAGHLCGMICSALPPTSDDEEHVSYVVSVWPAMAIMIELDRVGHPSRQPRGGSLVDVPHPSQSEEPEQHHPHGHRNQYRQRCSGLWLEPT